MKKPNETWNNKSDSKSLKNKRSHSKRSKTRTLSMRWANWACLRRFRSAKRKWAAPSLTSERTRDIGKSKSRPDCMKKWEVLEEVRTEAGNSHRGWIFEMASKWLMSATSSVSSLKGLCQELQEYHKTRRLCKSWANKQVQDYHALELKRQLMTWEWIILKILIEIALQNKCSQDNLLQIWSGPETLQVRVAHRWAQGIHHPTQFYPVAATNKFMSLRQCFKDLSLLDPCERRTKERRRGMTMMRKRKR